MVLIFYLILYYKPIKNKIMINYEFEIVDKGDTNLIRLFDTLVSMGLVDRVPLVGITNLAYFLDKAGLTVSDSGEFDQSKFYELLENYRLTINN